MIRLLRQLWADEAGYILSAEAVTVGTIGVVGATVGIGAVSESVNQELKETAYAIRSLDQSYCIPAQYGCGAWTAGSCFVQQDVEEARADLGLYIQNQGGTPLDLPPDETNSPEVIEQQRMEREEIKDSATQNREEQRRIRQRKREERRRLREQKEGDTAGDATSL